MKKIFFACSLLTLTLTACVPVVLVGAGAVAGTSLARDSRSLQTISDDTDIQFQAAQKIQQNKLTATGTNINVTSFNYVVLLTGQVASAEVRTEAETLVQSVPKVRRVYNKIEIAPQIGMIQKANDASISTNIKGRMLVTNNLNTNNFKYVVENKVVYLMGYATREETQVALDVIRNSAGVKRVVNLVQLEDQSTTTTPAPTTTAPTSPPVT
ncbi:BON domain-containing protein, partial [Candidatus Dependentiae bacterium]|nr:BON domain-containing protein [Candidatus Dependentiae bacterium]